MVPSLKDNTSPSPTPGIESPRNLDTEKSFEKPKRESNSVDKYTRHRRHKINGEYQQVHSSPFYVKQNTSNERNVNSSSQNLRAFNKERKNTPVNNSVNNVKQNEGEETLSYDSGTIAEKVLRKLSASPQKAYRLRHLSTLQGNETVNQEQNQKVINRRYLNSPQEPSNESNNKPVQSYLPSVNNITKGKKNSLPIVTRKLNASVEVRQESPLKAARMSVENKPSEENNEENSTKLLRKIANIKKESLSPVKDGPRGYLFKSSSPERRYCPSPDRSFEEKSREFNQGGFIGSLSNGLEESFIDNNVDKSVDSKLNETQKEESMELTLKKPILKDPSLRKFSVKDEAALEKKWKEGFYMKYAKKTNSLQLDTDFSEERKRVSFAANQINEENSFEFSNKGSFEYSKNFKRLFSNGK